MNLTINKKYKNIGGDEVHESRKAFLKLVKEVRSRWGASQELRLFRPGITRLSSLQKKKKRMTIVLKQKIKKNWKKKNIVKLTSVNNFSKMAFIGNSIAPMYPIAVIKLTLEQATLLINCTTFSLTTF